MAADYRHAGLHWNNGPSKDARLYALPSPVILMLSTEARYRSADAFVRGKQLVYRAVPRVGHRPAELKYNASKIADECLLLWSEQPHDPAERVIFQALNEPTINTERGDDEDDFSNLDARFKRLAKLESELEPEVRRRLPPGTLLMSTPQVPDGRAYDRLNLWWDAANQYDCIGTHQYGPPEGIRDQVQWHLDTWPDRGVFLGEWHNNEPERTLQLLADLAAREPRFLGATWFIGHWFDAPSDWPAWKNLQDNDDLYSIFLHPPVVAQPEPAPSPDPIPVPEPTPMTEYEQFIRDAAQKRGINPDIAVRVANSEGSVTEPARRGTFDTGSSWWAFQLHYGGPGYEQYGTAAGMGTGFTELTGWQPGDPAAWKDATRYALNRAKLSGWGAWYGAAHVGIGQWDGIDRNVAWNANSETWDYEAGVTPMPDRVTYNAGTPAIAQNDPWSCSTTALRWALTALGRHPAESWIEDAMKAEGVVTEADGLLDATGKGLADFVTREYGEFGFYANNEPSVTFDGVALEGDHAYPLLIGGRAWGHWSGVRGYDAANDLLLLANPADGWQGVGQTMNRGQFAALGPFSMVRVLHPDLLTALPPAPPIPVPMPQPTRAHVLVQEIRERLDELANLVA